MVELNQFRLFQVLEKIKKKNGKTKEKIRFFTLKSQAKELRDSLIDKGQKEAHVELGPDHDDYYTNQQEAGWNRGKHPKKGHKGKNPQKSFWQK